MSEIISDYYYVVIGCGGIGSAALYWLARTSPQGKKVLGLEQFKLGHDNGGSQDHSRIIRLMYHDEKYTKLTPDTYKAWEEVEKESGMQLVYKTGSMDITRHGSPGEAVLDEYAHAMSAQNIPYERLKGSEIRQRFPQFTTSDDTLALYQKDGGLVDAALGNALHVQLARARGATILENCQVTRLQPESDQSILVYTSKGIYRAGRIIVTAGAWINHVLGTVGVHVPIIVTQEQVTYFATSNITDFTKAKFPVYIFHADDRDFYGLPIHGNSGVKIGIDVGGPSVTPETRGYIPDPEREKICVDFLQKNIPKSLGPILSSKTCLYDMPYDRDFLVDNLRHNNLPNVYVCCGAGHAYKFAGLLGKILSELAIDGNTKYDIRGFNFHRPAITDSNFKPTFYLGLPQETTASKL